MKQFTVTEDTTLLEFLVTKYPRKQAKKFLAHSLVQINQAPVQQFNHRLCAGDSITISKHNPMHNKLDILYEDARYIVINKPSGLLSMSDGQEKEKTAYHMVREYVRQNKRGAKIFIVHRLDRDTSGVLLFSKSEKYKHALQNAWNDLVFKRGYIAIVEGYLARKKGTIETFLQQTSTHQVYVSKKGGVKAITKYRVLLQKNNYSGLEIFISTGRRNQIRAHMDHIGHSIVHDPKYNGHSNPIGRLGLHAHVLALKEPDTGVIKEFRAPIPKEFHPYIPMDKIEYEG